MKKTATDGEGIFYLRPLFYSDTEAMKNDLSESNFKVYYETFKNPNNPFIRKLLRDPVWKTQRAQAHPSYDKYLKYKALDDISTVAMIVDRKTKQELTQNENLTPGSLFHTLQSYSAVFSCNYKKSNR